MSSHSHHVNAQSPGVQLGEIGPRIFRSGMTLGAICLGLAAAFGATGMLGVDAHAFFRSYMVAFLYVTAICLGGLFFTLIHHAVRSGWSTSLRRLAESIAANFTWLWVLFLPIFVLVLMGKGGVLFEWLAPEAATDPVLQHKAAYLNKGFFLLRAVVFLGGWALLSRFLWATSVAQDASGDVALTHRMQRVAPLGIVFFALTLTFAAFDWAMSLSPHWFSTIFGVYFFAISCCGFFAFLAILVHRLRSRSKLLNEVTPEHQQDIGKLLFAFGVVFHAYIGFSQFMLIWYANLPEETGWFLARTLGPWLPFMWALALLHFGVPFVLLVTKHTKRRGLMLAGIAAWMLVMQYVDIYLLVMPHISNEALHSAASYADLKAAVDAHEIDLGFHPAITDLLCVVGMMGLLVGMTARRLGQAALVPVRDPRLGEALAFENI